MSDLSTLNGFTLGIDGVYQAGTESRVFNYSDGEESEKLLFQILSTSDDLSSASEELQQQIVDWPTEYHLSSTRSNLLRPLNLSGVTRVLELGCGCGSISRFLGEQDGIEVDAIEGSPTRAGLAALRCRDLPNVRISTANFNEIDFPENYYDLVLFVGVTEYAGRFSERNTDLEALEDLLNIGKRATKKDGATLVAIENRLGLKYLMGANEDHYAQRFVGLQNYPDSTGIRTYSRDEWLSNTKDFAHTHFLFPFPDYKVPSVIINEAAIESNKEQVTEELKLSKSRDYLSKFTLGDDENQIWNGLLQSNSFAEHANSFLLVLTDSASTLERLCDFTIISYSNPQPAYLEAAKDDFCPEQYAQKLHNVEEHLNAQITQLQSHSANLEAKVDLMSGSIGWRFLDGIRRLFGKNII
jgi:cyclopropane fatty-acyl-phospholipid synthase-like methyltransferase